jgi:tRNA-(ms[2]io[6]A)-hydroxylase
VAGSAAELSGLLPGRLVAATPGSWFERASRSRDELLLDHANCEKKAASTALALMFAYPDDTELALRMSRLAREELRHFELVQARLRALRVPFRRLSPSRYAAGLRRALRHDEPGRGIDLLLTGALIEARSHERFAGLASRLEPELGGFYASLAAAEERHAHLYLRLAERRSADIPRRWRDLAVIEAELATQPDAQFRFHSGAPA